MRRLVSLGVWPGSLLLIWLAITSTITLYIPFELAKVPRETRINLPVSNVLAKYPDLVHRLNPTSSVSGITALSSAYYRIVHRSTVNDKAASHLQVDGSPPDEPIVIEPAKAAEVDPGALVISGGSTWSPSTEYTAYIVASGAMAHLIQPTLVPLPSRASLFVHNRPTVIKAAWYALITRWVFTASCDIYLSTAANRSYTCNLASPPQKPESDSLPSGISSLSRITTPLHVYWSHTRRFLRKSKIDRWFLPAEQHLSKAIPLCACERDHSAVAIVQQGEPDDMTSPPEDSSQTRLLDVNLNETEAKDPPAPRIHDCGMDDPNWQIVISFGPFQSRSCRPTYTEWQPEDNSAPSSNDDPAAAELVFADPLNRSINMNFRFAFCQKHSAQTLIIFGSMIDRICVRDTDIEASQPKSAGDDNSNETLHLNSLSREDSPTLLPSRAVVAIEPTTISDSMEIITESDPIEAILISAPEPALVPSEHVSIEPQTTFPSFFQFISRFGSLAFVVMLLVASILYLAAQAILAPIYAPLVIHVFRRIPLIGRHFRAPERPMLVDPERAMLVDPERAIVGRSTIKRGSSASRRAGFRISHRESSKAGKRPHPLLSAPPNSDGPQKLVYRSPPASRPSVLNLSPKVPAAGAVPPSQPEIEFATPQASRDTAFGIGQRTPDLPVQVRSRSAKSSPASPCVVQCGARARPSAPKAIGSEHGNLGSIASCRKSDEGKCVDRKGVDRKGVDRKGVDGEHGSLESIASFRKMDKGKGVDRSPMRPTINPQNQICPSTVQSNIDSQPSTSYAPESSSKVNLPRSGFVLSMASSGSKRLSLSDGTSHGDGMQLDDEGRPIKPMLRRSPARGGQSPAQADTQQSETSTSDLPTAQVYFDENCQSKITPQASTSNKTTSVRGIRRPLAAVKNASVGAAENSSAPPVASPITTLPRILFNRPVDLGVRIQPYYDIEMDSLHYGPGFEERQLPGVQHVEGEAALCRRRSMEKISRRRRRSTPLKPDPFPAGARLKPLRV